MIAGNQSFEYVKNRKRGLEKLAAGHITEAIEALGNAVHLRPDLFEAHFDMGRAFERAGKIEAARQAYLRAHESDKERPEAASALKALPAPPPEHADFSVGQVVIGSVDGTRYRILGVKRGGFGAVYIVEDEKGLKKALKTFQARYLWSDADRERFEREALTWIMLDRHENIVTLEYITRVEAFSCLVLELLDGGDLKGLLEKGPLAPERALELSLQFCDGMAYAHKKLGIVHRDIKPANCLLSAEGTLKVTDFGLARVFGQAREEALGLSGLAGMIHNEYTTAAGTMAYMAPEQFRAGATLDVRTDIYAYGIMLYEMLSCDRPLRGDIAREHITTNEETYKIPEGIRRLILRCVEHEPAKRPADFGAVRVELESVFKSLTGKAAPVQRGPDSAVGWDLFPKKGLALNQLGYPQEAIACYDRGLAIMPRDYVLWLNKGGALDDLGRHQEAVDCYDRGLKINPKDSNLWNNKGLALKKLGRKQEAIACYDHGLGSDPLNRVLWCNKGISLSDLGRHQDAIACFDRGLEIDPRSNELWQNKAAALGTLGRHQEAIICCDRGLEINPRNSGLWNNKGFALRKLDREQEAIACFDRGLEISPQDFNLWKNKGAGLSALGRHQDAIACWDRGLEINPRDIGLWKCKGISFMKLAQFKAAIACYDRGLDLNPKDSRLWNNKGIAFFKFGKIEDAIICYDNGLKINPRDIDLWNNKQVAFKELGLITEALACHLKVRELGG